MDDMKMHIEGSAIDSSSSRDFFDEWLEVRDRAIRRHRRILLREKDGARDAIRDDLRNVVRRNYASPAITARRLTELGAVRTAALLRDAVERRYPGDVFVDDSGNPSFVSGYPRSPTGAPTLAQGIGGVDKYARFMRHHAYAHYVEYR